MKKTILQSFIKFEANKNDLIKILGNDLFNVTIDPEIVTSQDVLCALQKYWNKEIDLSSLVEWVNTIWFTDLFGYSDNESNCISSVMSVLETLDEEGVHFTESEYEKMTDCLMKNTDTKNK